MEKQAHVIIDSVFYCDVVEHDIEANKHTVADCRYSGGVLRCRVCFATLELKSLSVKPKFDY